MVQVRITLEDVDKVASQRKPHQHHWAIKQVLDTIILFKCDAVDNCPMLIPRLRLKAGDKN